MSRRREADVVMVGLVPPPFHGQSIMTKTLFDSDLSPVRVAVVEARFNQEIGQVSAFQFRKLLELVRVIWRCLGARFRTRARVLYYTPGSAKLVPFLKDVILLGTVRPFFKVTLLHYHSGGLPEFLERRWWTRFLARWTYGRRKAWAIALTDKVPVPGVAFGAARELVIANGILGAPDSAGTKSNQDQIFTIVFLGNLYWEKGVHDALVACLAAAKSLPHRSFRFEVAGGSPEADLGDAIAETLNDCPENLEVSLVGALDAAAKWAFLQRADVMLFPSFYSSENFPLVLLEAMACGLPIVATQWRGIPSIVAHGETGFLAEVGDVDVMAQSLAALADSPDLQARMSQSARQAFEEHYDWPQFVSKVRDCFLSAIKA